MKRKFGHWTPRYIVNRAKLWQYEKRHPADPWLTSRAIEFLSQWLRPTDVGFEWGSGRSTLWFAKRVKHLTSIEHDPAWYEIVQSRLKLQQLDNVQHRLLALQDGADSTYVHAIDTIENGSLDFVLVDGRLRAFCVLAALEKLRPGAILVIDNVNLYMMKNGSGVAGSFSEGETAEAWQSIHRQINRWRALWTSNGISDTGIFWCPAHDEGLSGKKR
jgi:hypothetical protein